MCKSCVATLLYTNKTIKLTFSVLPESTTKDYTFAFCIWTDNISHYVCVEPVLGVGMWDGTLPHFFTLTGHERILLKVSIELIL